MSRQCLYFLGIHSWLMSFELLAAEPFVARITVTPSKVELPAPVTVTLDLHYPGSYHVDGDSLRGNLLRTMSPGIPPFVLMDVTRSVEEDPKSDGVVEKLVYTLEPQLEGIHPLTFYNIGFIPAAADEKRHEFYSAIESVEVALPAPSELPDRLSAALLPLKRSLPLELSPEVQYALKDAQAGALARANSNVQRLQANHFPWRAMLLLLFGGVSLWLLRQKYRTGGEHPIAAVPTAKELCDNAMVLIAKGERDQLSPSGAPALIEDLLQQLTCAVRLFLAERYQLSLEGRTSEELVDALAHADRTAAVADDQLPELIATLDALKFAGHTPSLPLCRLLADRLSALIQSGKGE
jgi:hypothetical protein